MFSEVRRIRSLIKSCYDGPAWHGPAVLETLKKIDYQVVGRRMNGSHNIIELVNHMASWKLFIIKKLEGDPDFDVVGSINFTTIDHPTEEDWKAAKKRLQTIHNDLMEKLKFTEDSVLVEGVPGRSYNFFFLLTGIVNHSLYHLGQIILLLKLEESNNSLV